MKLSEFIKWYRENEEKIGSDKDHTTLEFFLDQLPDIVAALEEAKKIIHEVHYYGESSQTTSRIWLGKYFPLEES